MQRPIERLRMADSRILLCLLLFAVSASCATPGRPYLVVPAVTGVVRGAALSLDSARLQLTTLHRESPSLSDRRRFDVDRDGEFYFDELQLVVAGHEYSKSYRVYLHLQSGGQDRVIWRAVLSRRALAGLIQLDCDLDRASELGQPCWVDHPLQHPWLVEEGARAFEKMCATCHGKGGRGDVSTTADMSVRPPDLARIAARREGRFDRAQLAEWIDGRTLSNAHGSRVMPVWGARLSEEFERYADGDELIGATLDPVLAYLESIQVMD